MPTLQKSTHLTLYARHDQPSFQMPTCADQARSEYAMLKAAEQNGWLDERKAVLETLTCSKRAGCAGILTYYAGQVAMWMRE